MRRLSVLFVLLFAVASLHAQERPHNVIFFVTDGFGPASVTFARDYVRLTEGRDSLAFDPYLTGSLGTHATDSRVTDSAAGATAFATGHRSYNGSIAVDTLKRPLGTLLEGAEKKGMATGLVVTTRITHATPAAFSAHVPQRGSENDIALQQMNQHIDLLVGGGARHYVPTDQGGIRPDGRDLLAEMAADGYTVVRDLAGFRALNTTPAIALLQLEQLAYEVDRDPAEEPSLAEMTEKAISLLKGDRDGFFLMVEASRIDHAGHENDAAGHLHDILAFEKAFAAAIEFARKDGHTLVVSTSDHETGGLSLGRDGVYAWKTEVLVPMKSSQMILADTLAEGANADTLLLREMGLKEFSKEEIASMQKAIATKQVRAVNKALSELIAKRAGIAWTTTGHTAVDVNLYAFGPGSGTLRGHFPNEALGQKLARLLNVDLDTVTRELRAAE